MSRPASSALITSTVSHVRPKTNSLSASVYGRAFTGVDNLAQRVRDRRRVGELVKPWPPGLHGTGQKR